jgi:hypothetical protein
MSFAVRELSIVTEKGNVRMAVRILEPQPEDRGWACQYEIDWPGKPRIGAGYGIDGVQALIIAMQKVAVELYASSYHKAGTLVFDRPGNGYGFPMTKNGRDLLVGDDAKYDGA